MANNPNDAFDALLGPASGKATTTAATVPTPTPAATQARGTQARPSGSGDAFDALLGPAVTRSPSAQPGAPQSSTSNNAFDTLLGPPPGQTNQRRGESLPDPTVRTGEDEYERMGGGESWYNKPLTTSLLGWGEYRQGAGGFERGLEKFGSSLSSPLNLALMLVTGGVGGVAEAGAVTAGEVAASEGLSLAGKAALPLIERLGPELAGKVATSAKVIDKLATAGFGMQMIGNLSQAVPQLGDAIKSGDYDKAIELATSASLGAVAIGLTGHHFVRSFGEIPKSPTWTGDKDVYAAEKRQVTQYGTRAENFADSNKDLIKNKPLDIAARLYHEAGGDSAVLEKWRQDLLDDKNVRVDIQRKWENYLNQAQGLPDEVKNLSTKLREDYARDWEEEYKAGFVKSESGHENYSGTHTYVPKDEGGSSLRNVGFRSLTKSPSYLKPASFENIMDAVHAGYEPKEVGLVAARHDYIIQRGSKAGAVAAEQELKNQKGQDGRPGAVWAVRRLGSRRLTPVPQDADLTGFADVPVVDDNGQPISTVKKPPKSEAPPLSDRGVMAASGGDAWRIAKYDTPATNQAIAERTAGTLPEGVSVSTRAQIIKDQLLEQSRASGELAAHGQGAASLEELNRAGVNFKVTKSGELTYLGKQVDETLKPGEALVGVDPRTGSWDVHDGNHDTAKLHIERIMNAAGGRTVSPLPGLWTMPTDPELFQQALEKEFPGKTLGDLDKDQRTLVGLRAERIKTDAKTNISREPTAIRRPILEPDVKKRLVVYKGKYYYDVSDYKEGPDLFRRTRLREILPSGEQIFDHAPPLVHPDLHDTIKTAYDDNSWFRKNPVMRTLLGASGQTKRSLLAWSPFHWTTEYLRGLQMGLNPVEAFNPARLTENSLAVKSKFPPTLSTARERSLAQEGLASGSHLVEKVPFLGPLQKAMEERLFGSNGYIDRLKGATFEKITKQLSQRHPNWTEDQIHYSASRTVDAAFGGLDWKALGASANTRDFLRLMMLAPDFTGSQVLFGKYGMEAGGSVVAHSLMRIAAYNFLAARAINMLVSGKAHLEHPFSVVSPDEKHLITMRTMPEDLMHLLTDPRGFAYNRMNPLVVRTGWEMLTGKDEQGKRATAEKQLHDLLRNIIPIPSQNVLPGYRREGEGIGTSLLRSAGLAVQPNMSYAQNKAHQLAADHSPMGPVSSDKLDQHRRVLALEDQVRERKIDMGALREERTQGNISLKDEKDIIKNYHDTHGMSDQLADLYSKTSRLPMNQFLEVYDVATGEEKAALHRLLQEKSKKYREDHTSKDPTYQRLQRMLPPPVKAAGGSSSGPSSGPSSGQYSTSLSPQEEAAFQEWVKKNNVPWEDSPTSDYDMRGYWKAKLSGDPNAKTERSSFDGKMHFPDTYKTPYHRTFSDESRYATGDAPHWIGDKLVDKKGNVVVDETPKGR